MRKTTSIALAAVLATAAVAAPPAPVTLVICAPGYPSNTTEAQPSMDALAAAAAKAVGWPPTKMKAVYYETEQGGVDRFRSKDPSVALVPLPFYLRHADDLKLVPRSQAVLKGGSASETWTLVAKAGRLTGPASLSGWEIVGLASYAPDFVRNVAFRTWGPIPKDATFTPSGQVLSALRRAASGENVAVLLDGAEAAALAGLPFAKDLQAIAVSPPLPAVVLCTVGSKPGAADVKALTAGLMKMSDTPEGAAALDAVRLTKFIPLDAKGVAGALGSYRGDRVAEAR
jgi:ABC transporter, phosphonate, periplasmic substrate-binding protein